MAEPTLIHVEGMTCSSCARTVTRALEKEGLKNVRVNYLTNEVTFDVSEKTSMDHLGHVIASAGYRMKKEHTGAVNSPDATGDHAHHDHGSGVVRKFWWSAAFTAPLLLHMVLPFHFLHNPWVQLVLCLPVMVIGIKYFGKSAWGSVRTGVPNMDVLVFIGSTAAFVYSLAGMYLYSGTPQVEKHLFFETAASIICFVMLGNVLEHVSVKRTTSALLELSRLQPQRARRIITGDGNHAVEEVDVKEVRAGDHLQVPSGEKIPLDGVVTSGKALVNESMITGESVPVTRTIGDPVTGGTLVEEGNLQFRVERTGSETTLSKIMKLVKDAQFQKPAIQKLGDRVSAVFVPVVLSISLGTFLVSLLLLELGSRESIMRSIAVLVISCPCAMGLATPTALMVGIGKAARKGILIKGGNTIEEFAGIKTIVFDKTGTLTTGELKIENFNGDDGSKEEAKRILLSLEQFSNHPIARSVQKELSDYRDDANHVKWSRVEEDKGIGINATDAKGNLYSAGSFVMARHATSDDSHSLYLLKNNALLATVDLRDELKADAKETVARLKSLGIKTVMVSGDRKRICDRVAKEAGIDEVYSEQLPAQKLQIIEELSRKGKTAMVGDGINDAPALAKAYVGVSLSTASQVAIQSAQVVLLNGKELHSLLDALYLSRMTLRTIRQNLFWAFAYNVIAIPVAAAGMLSPAVSALSMAFSDVVLIGNSLRLRYKKIVSGRS